MAIFPPLRPHWLTARPVAHRGLHDPALGRIENTIPAFDAAMERGFAIELDVQLTADGDAVVFHDHTLDRLTDKVGPVRDLTKDELSGIEVTGSGTPIPSLAKVLAHVDGRSALFIEIKSRFDGELGLADAVAGALAAYTGPVALMSFDPVVMARIRSHNTGCPLGIVADRMALPYWEALSWRQRFAQANLLHGQALRADFIAYDQGALPSLAPVLFKLLGRKALMSWTVRDAKTARRVLRYADQIIFEGFDPHG